jgi:hypothetical protein
MTPERLLPGACPADRVDDILRGARDRLFEGLVSDAEAVQWCIDHGLIRRVYEGAAGFMGFAKLEIVR